jgi:hypothetical protein
MFVVWFGGDNSGSASTMRVFTTLPQENLTNVGAAAQAIEATGYTGVSTQENRHEPFLSLAVAGAAHPRVRAGGAGDLGGVEGRRQAQLRGQALSLHVDDAQLRARAL